MKQYLTLIALAATLAACSNTTPPTGTGGGAAQVHRQEATGMGRGVAQTPPQETTGSVLERAHAVNRDVVLNHADPRAKELSLKETTLQTGRSYTQTFNLQAGKFYTFYGDCDEGCSNLDMELRNSRNARVAGDNLPDDQPLFTYQAPRNGSYRIVLSMKNCADSNGCKASIHAFEGTRHVYGTFTRQR